MVRWSLAVLAGCCLMIVLAGCRTDLDRSKEGIDVFARNFASTARAFEFLDSRAACVASSECMLMRVGGCGDVQAIHVSQVELANAYTTFVKETYPDVVCAPELPIEEYEPLCLNRQCLEVVRRSRLLLEVPEQPVAGKPFWMGLSFRFAVDAPLVEARFMLPDAVKVLDGQDAWSGPVLAGEDRTMWVQLQTNSTGSVYLSGWVGIKEGDPAISPLVWGKYFDVVLEQELTPQPEAERILPTPTPPS